MKFYGQFDPPVDKYIYDTFFKNDERKNNGFFIECGAFDGKTECSCKFFEETLKWHGINIEASPPVYRQLVENRPDTTNINAALSNFSGESEFIHVIHPILGEMFGNGSLVLDGKHKKELDEQGCTYEKYQVNVITYMQLIERYNVSKIDLFVLDVEGNELNVIESMKGCKILPEVFCVEHGNLDKEEVRRKVEDLGYKYHSESFVNSFFVRLNPMQRIIRKIIK